jgi:DNA-binding beta-propeller fold protein YncE
MKRQVLRRTPLTVAALALGLLALAPGASAATAGSLTQLPGSAGCWIRSFAFGCSHARAQLEASSLAFSPDGKFLYVANGPGDTAQTVTRGGITIFARNPGTGQISQLPGAQGCVTEDATDGSGGPCTSGIGLHGTKAIAMAPDGKHVYVGESGSDLSNNRKSAILLFDRNSTTGALSQSATAPCIGDGSDTDCPTGARQIQDITSMVVVGGNLYVTSGHITDSDPNGALTMYNLDPTTGAPTQPSGTTGCFQEDPAPNCAAARQMREPTSVVSVGSQLYVSASEGMAPASGGDNDGAVVRFDRANDGTLTQPAGKPGCLNRSGTSIDGPNTCETGKALHDARWLAASPDGNNLYLATEGDPPAFSGNAIGSLVVLARAANGDLTQTGCFSRDGTNGYAATPTGVCTAVRGMYEASGVVVSPDGNNVYVATSDGPGGIVTFARNTSTGALTQLNGAEGCATTTGDDGDQYTCAVSRATSGATALAVSSETAAGACKSLYVGSTDLNSFGLSVFAREPACPQPGGGNQGPCPSSVFSVGKVKANVKDGSLIIRVTANCPGTVEAKATATTKKKKKKQASKLRAAKTIAAGSASQQVGTLTLILKPSKAAKSILSKKGKLAVTVKITYRPTGGTASSKTIKTKLKLKLKKK